MSDPRQARHDHNARQFVLNHYAQSRRVEFKGEVFDHGPSLMRRREGNAIQPVQDTFRSLDFKAVVSHATPLFVSGSPLGQGTI